MFSFLKQIFGGATGMDAQQAKALLDKDPHVIVVDVRQAGEYRGGHLPRAQHIPVGLMPQRAQRLDKEATYLVYCLHGARSSRAASAMTRAGIKNVYKLRGGITAWQGAGFRTGK